MSLLYEQKLSVPHLVQNDLLLSSLKYRALDVSSLAGGADGVSSFEGADHVFSFEGGTDGGSSLNGGADCVSSFKLRNLWWLFSSRRSCWCLSW